MAINILYKRNVSGSTTKQAVTENDLKLAIKVYSTHDIAEYNNNDKGYTCKKCKHIYNLDNEYKNILWKKSNKIELYTCNENIIKKLLE